MNVVRVVIALLALVLLASCGDENSAPSPTSPAFSPAAASAPATSPSVTPPASSERQSLESAPTESTESEVPSPATEQEEPYIVSCQIGLGPAITTWSDGTTSGHSDYCQAQHDEVLQNEVESGATIPDPDAVTPETTTPNDPLAELPADCRTSGCIQTYHGCKDGTITGEACDRLGF